MNIFRKNAGDSGHIARRERPAGQPRAFFRRALIATAAAATALLFSAQYAFSQGQKQAANLADSARAGRNGRITLQADSSTVVEFRGPALIICTGNGKLESIEGGSVYAEWDSAGKLAHVVIRGSPRDTIFMNYTKEARLPEERKGKEKK